MWLEGHLETPFPWDAPSRRTDVYLLTMTIILLLILLFGPCILNRLVQFIKDRFSVIQALALTQQQVLVLTQQYHQLRQFDPETEIP